MADPRITEPLTPSAIDREIDRALAAVNIDPSPDFVARIRRRVANEPAPRSAWTPWKMRAWMPIAGAALLAAAVVAAVLIGPRHKDGRDIRLIVKSASDVQLRPDTTAAVQPESDSAGAVVASAVRRMAKEPEVLIAPDEAAALRRLFAQQSQGQLAEVVVEPQRPAWPPGAPPLPPEIAIDPVKIEPLVFQINGEGERQ